MLLEGKERQGKPRERAIDHDNTGNIWPSAIIYVEKRAHTTKLSGILLSFERWMDGRTHLAHLLRVSDDQNNYFIVISVNVGFSKFMRIYFWGWITTPHSVISKRFHFNLVFRILSFQWIVYIEKQHKKKTQNPTENLEDLKKSAQCKTFYSNIIAFSFWDFNVTPIVLMLFSFVLVFISRALSSSRLHHIALGVSIFFFLYIVEC